MSYLVTEKGQTCGVPGQLIGENVASDTSLGVALDDTYSIFEKGYGAKLNQSESEGLWHVWNGRIYPPPPLPHCSQLVPNQNQDPWSLFRNRIGAISR